MKKSNNSHATPKKGNKTPMKPTTTKTQQKQNFAQTTAPVAIGNTFRKQAAKQTRLSDNHVRIEHVELFRSLTLTPNSPDPYFENVLSQTVQPGNGAFSEWLSEIAQRYEQYQINHLHFIMKTSMPTSMGGNVLMMTDIDAADPTTYTESTFMSAQNSCEGPVWQNLTHRIPNSACHKWLYVNDGTIPYGTDIKTYNAGTFQIGVNFPQSFGVPQKLIFRIFIDYSIDFRTPQLKNNNVIMKSLNSSAKLFPADTPDPSVGPSFSKAPDIASGVSGSFQNGNFTDPTKPYLEQQHGLFCPKGAGIYGCVWKSRWLQSVYTNQEVVSFTNSTYLGYLNSFALAFLPNLDFVFGDGTGTAFETFYLNLPTLRLVPSSGNPFDPAYLEVELTFGFLTMISTLVFLPILRRTNLATIGIYPLFDELGGVSVNRIGGPFDNLTLQKLYTHKKDIGQKPEILKPRLLPATITASPLEKDVVCQRLKKLVDESFTAHVPEDDLDLKSVTTKSSQTTLHTLTETSASVSHGLVPIIDAHGTVVRYLDLNEKK